MLPTTPRQSPRSRVHAYLRAALSTGRYRPGEAISIVEVAATLALSTTPVREGLCRLVGEMLVEDRDRDGFRMAYLSSRDISETYRVEAELFVAALAADRSRRTPVGAEATLTDVIAGPANATLPAALEQIRAHCVSRPLRGTLLNFGERLAPYRAQEAAVLTGLNAEADELNELLAMARWPALQAAIRRYARRRTRVAAALHDCSSALRAKRS